MVDELLLPSARVTPAKLVEIVRPITASDETVRAATSFAESCGKDAVEVQELDRRRSVEASVNAPLTCPKNSLSYNSCGIDAQLHLIIGCSLRRLRLWISRATSSFPVPLSPWIKIGLSLAPIRSINRKTSRMAAESPIMLKGWRDR